MWQKGSRRSPEPQTIQAGSEPGNAGIQLVPASGTRPIAAVQGSGHQVFGFEVMHDSVCRRRGAMVVSSMFISSDSFSGGVRPTPRGSAAAPAGRPGGDADRSICRCGQWWQNGRPVPTLRNLPGGGRGAHRSGSKLSVEPSAISTGPGRWIRVGAIASAWRRRGRADAAGNDELRLALHVEVFQRVDRPGGTAARVGIPHMLEKAGLGLPAVPACMPSTDPPRRRRSGRASLTSLKVAGGADLDVYRLLPVVSSRSSWILIARWRRAGPSLDGGRPTLVDAGRQACAWRRPRAATPSVQQHAAAAGLAPCPIPSRWRRRGAHVRVEAVARRRHW